MRPPFADAGLGADAAALAPAASSGLQLVKVSRARKEATIDGRTVRVGEKVGDATLREVTDSSVTLVGPDGERNVLRLYPDADKKVASRARVAMGGKKDRQ